MKAGKAFRSQGVVALAAVMMLVATQAAVAQRAGGAAGAGHAGGAHAVHRSGGYGGRGYGWGGRWGWGWGPGWGWWPMGVYLSVLPWYYTTYWWDGVPYYYADNAYYTWNGSAYEQVEPPAEFTAPAHSAAAPGAGELFAYPRKGQSAAQQATDKSECRAWAVSQSGYGATANGAAQRQDYLRAEAACLEGRGYAAR